MESAKSMSADMLPDEILIKIFRYLLDNQKNFHSLRQTSRRFNYIVNYKLLNIQDEQFPVLCPYVDQDYCKYDYCLTCCNIVQKAHYKYVKFRGLCLFDKECCLETLIEQSSRLSSITLLRIVCTSGATSVPIILDRVMSCLPNIAQLEVVGETMSKSLPGFKREREKNLFKPLASRVLVNLSVSGILANELLEYLLVNFPAKQLRIVWTVFNTDLWNETWIERYLTRHQSIVTSCQPCIESCSKQNLDLLEKELYSERNREFRMRVKNTLVRLGY